jgi:hypothetical protein
MLPTLRFGLRHAQRVGRDQVFSLVTVDRINIRFCTRIWNNVRLARVWQFVRFGSRSRRRCGNVGTRVLCGFPSSEGRQNLWDKRSIIPPSERHFHSEAPFIGRAGGNLVFGRSAVRNSSLSKTA